jgi:hypothetical protein
MYKYIEKIKKRKHILYGAACFGFGVMTLNTLGAFNYSYLIYPSLKNYVNYISIFAGRVYDIDLIYNGLKEVYKLALATGGTIVYGKKMIDSKKENDKYKKNINNDKKKLKKDYKLIEAEYEEIIKKIKKDKP